MRHSKVVFVLGIGFFLLLGSRLTAATAEKTFHKRLAFRSGGQVSVSNVNGDVTVAGWSADSVEITAEIRVRAKSERRAQDALEEVEIDIERESGYLHVEPDYPWKDGRSLLDRLFGGKKPEVQVRFWLKVPERTDIEVSSVNGTVTVEAVDGEHNLSSVNGAIVGRNLRGGADAHTVNGSIKLDFTAVDPEGQVSCKTVNGGVRLTLPEDVRADVRVSTVNGSIRSDFPIELSGKYVGRSATGEINGGGADITVKTVNGSVKILKRKAETGTN